MATITHVTIPINGVATTLEIEDAAARQAISDLGDAVYWVGITTSVLTDGSSTNPIVVDGSDVTVHTGGMAQYDGEEFVFSKTGVWQSIGKANFGALAFKNSASGSITPAGTVAITEAADTTTSIEGMATAGTLPQWSLSGKTLTFTQGTLPTKATAQTVVTASGTRTAAFTGTSTSVTVS